MELILLVIIFVADQFLQIEWLDKNPEWMIIGVIMLTVSLHGRHQDKQTNFLLARLDHIEKCLGCEPFIAKIERRE